MQAMGLLAGKWPHTLAVQPGGSTRPLQSFGAVRLQRSLREFRGFLEQHHLRRRWKRSPPLASRARLDAWHAQANATATCAPSSTIADDLDLWHASDAAPGAS
jgi:hypothetical protein